MRRNEDSRRISVLGEHETGTSEMTENDPPSECNANPTYLFESFLAHMDVNETSEGRDDLIHIAGVFKYKQDNFDIEGIFSLGFFDVILTWLENTEDPEVMAELIWVLDNAIIYLIELKCEQGLQKLSEMGICEKSLPCIPRLNSEHLEDGISFMDALTRTSEFARNQIVKMVNPDLLHSWLYSEFPVISMRAAELIYAIAEADGRPIYEDEPYFCLVIVNMFVERVERAGADDYSAKYLLMAISYIAEESFEFIDAVLFTNAFESVLVAFLSALTSSVDDNSCAIETALFILKLMAKRSPERMEMDPQMIMHWAMITHTGIAKHALDTLCSLIDQPKRAIEHARRYYTPEVGAMLCAILDCATYEVKMMANDVIRCMIVNYGASAQVYASIGIIPKLVDLMVTADVSQEQVNVYETLEAMLANGEFTDGSGRNTIAEFFYQDDALEDLANFAESEECAVADNLKVLLHRYFQESEEEEV